MNFADYLARHNGHLPIPCRWSSRHVTLVLAECNGKLWLFRFTNAGYAPGYGTWLSEREATDADIAVLEDLHDAGKLNPVALAGPEDELKPHGPNDPPCLPDPDGLEEVLRRVWTPDNPSPNDPTRCRCGASRDSPHCYCSC